MSALPPLDRLLGCHLSVAKGPDAALDSAEALGCNALQIFTHSPSMWRMKPLADEAAEAFDRKLRTSSVRYVVVHTMYLINLASPDPALYERSITAMIAEVRRAARLGIHQVVTHLGSHKGDGRDQGIQRLVAALDQVSEDEVFAQVPEMRVLLENTAGSGTTLGGSFEELRDILNAMAHPERFGVCFDTCHGFAAGYDLGTPRAVDKTFRVLDRTLGLERVELIHLNDSKFPLGSRRDRHQHLGQGHIGINGLQAMVGYPALQAVPLILETPKVWEGDEEADPINLSTLRALINRR